MQVKLSHHKLLTGKIVLIDGVARTGKTLVSKVLPSIHRFEQIEYAEFIEYILAGLRLNKVKNDFAQSFIANTLNEQFYNKLLGRKLNFRPSDITSVKKFKNANVYEKRLLMPEGDNVIKRLKKNKNFFPFMTHDVMVNYHLLKKLNFNFKIIEIYRNPFDVIASWYNRGWGSRFGKDPRSTTIVSEYRKSLCPWYVAGKEKQWLALNDIERCASVVSELINKSIVNHKKIKNRKKIFTLSYENFLENTENEILKICKFLKTKQTKFTKKALIKEKCPNVLDLGKQKEKRKFIKSKITKSLYEKLKTLTKSYEENLYGL